MTKKLTERQAWLYLAKCWEKAKFCRNANKFLAEIGRNGPLSSGLCTSIDKLDVIHFDVFSEMISKVPKGPGVYVWKTDARGAKQRVQFCLKMAQALAKPKKTGKPAKKQSKRG